MSPSQIVQKIQSRFGEKIKAVFPEDKHPRVHLDATGAHIRPGGVARPAAADRDGDARERTEARPGGDARDEPVGERDEQPALLEPERQRREDQDARGRDPGRGLVDGVREAEEVAHAVQDRLSLHG